MLPHSHTFFHGEQIIQRSLKVVANILDTTKNPQLAGDVDHQYADKYYLVELMTNTAIASILNVCQKFDGFNKDLFQSMVKEVKDENRSVTLRFKVQSKCDFFKEETIEVESPTSVQVTKEESLVGDKDGNETTSTTTTTKTGVTHKIINKVKQNHWKVEINHSLMLFTGTNQEKGVMLGERSATSTLITTTKDPPLSTDLGFEEDLNLSWLFKWIDPSNIKCNFSIDRDTARTPRRNNQVEEALAFMDHLKSWSSLCQKLGKISLRATPPENKRAVRNKIISVLLDKINSDNIFIPILPLLQQNKLDGSDETPVTTTQLVSLKESPEDSLVLPLRDVSQFLEEQCRSLQTELHESMQSCPALSDHEQVFTGYEVKLLEMWSHLKDLSSACTDGIDYIEHLLYKQLVQAIGKEVKRNDFNSFLQFHNQRLFPKQYAPKPFCYAVRQPNQYPDGVLSIVEDGFKDANDPIETFVRYIPGDALLSPMSIPINAGTTVQFTGDRYLHGWMDTFFGSEQVASNKHFLSARVRQFSCFLLVTGIVSSPNQFSPQDAIILQNGDDVLIPLLIQDLPPAKEFKDAIKSLSPQQARFAKQFRAMQLGSSLFGVCVIQVKPQLEALLNLPPSSLMKEMKLTQDLLSLFVEYQIPSSLLSYDASQMGASTHDKVSAVKTHVKGVMDVIEGLKESQLKEEVKKADMRAESMLNRFAWFDVDARIGSNKVRCSDLVTPMSANLSRCGSVQPGAAAGGRRSANVPRSEEVKKADMITELMCEGMGTFNRYGTIRKSAPAGARRSSNVTFRGLLGGVVQRSGAVRASKSVDVPRSASNLLRGGAPKSLVKATRQLGEPGKFNGTERMSSKISGSGNSTPKSAKLEGSLVGEDFKPLECTELGDRHTDRDDSSWGKSEAIDWTVIPKKLDSVFEEFDSSNALRTIVLSTGDQWTRERQQNLLSKPNKSFLRANEQKRERSKAMDLLDALSRSGSLPIASGELHVVVGVRHAFEQNVMETVIEKNWNPIEKVDYSSLLVASSIHNVTIPTLLRGSAEPPTQALTEGKFPSFMQEDFETTCASED